MNQLNIENITLEDIRNLQKGLKELENKKADKIYKSTIKENTKNISINESDKEKVIDKKDIIKPKVKRKITSKSQSARENAYKLYEDYLRLFNLIFNGVATKIQLFELFLLISDKPKNFINEIIEAIEEYGLSRTIDSKDDDEKLFILHSFSITRIYNNKNLRGLKKTKEHSLKKKIKRNDYILFLIKGVLDKEITIPTFGEIPKSVENKEVKGNINNQIKYLKEKYPFENIDFLNNFKNKTVIKYLIYYTNTTKQDFSNILFAYTQAFKKRGLTFYSDCFYEQIFLTAIKKQLISPKYETEQYEKGLKPLSKEELRQILKDGRSYEYKQRPPKQTSYFIPLDLEQRNIYIRKIEYKNNIMLIELDYLDVYSNLKSTSFQEEVLVINGIFKEAFGNGEIETFFININWHLETDISLELLKKRALKLQYGRGTKKATQSINNRFYVKGKLEYDQDVKPLNIIAPDKSKELNLKPIEAPEKPKNIIKEDKPVKAIKTPQKQFKEELEYTEQDLLDIFLKLEKVNSYDQAHKYISIMKKNKYSLQQMIDLITNNQSKQKKTENKSKTQLDKALVSYRLRANYNLDDEEIEKIIETLEKSNLTLEEIEKNL